MEETRIVIAPALSAETLKQVIVDGDLSRLTNEQKVEHYVTMCKITGLNPATKPFDYLEFQGKTVLYASKGATDQLRKLHKITISKLEKNIGTDYAEFTCYVEAPDGRQDVGTGMLTIKGLQGKNYENAIMKCETKAKRRATLSILGLGMLDESEIDNIGDFQYERQIMPGEPLSAKYRKEINGMPDAVKVIFKRLRKHSWDTDKLIQLAIEHGFDWTKIEETAGGILEDAAQIKGDDNGNTDNTNE